MLYVIRHSRSTAVPHHSVLDISCSSPTHTTSLLDQIFQFIGDQPETAVSYVSVNVQYCENDLKL